MKYCSECGAAIERRWVAQEGRERCVCLACGVTHYENPRVIVCCMVCWGDKVLLCRRAYEPGRGKWLAPCGFLENGETLEECAARETFEETGVIVDPAALDLYSVINMTSLQQVGIVFRVVLAAKPDIRLGPECMEGGFLGEDEISDSEFAWRELVGDAPPRFYEELRSGRFTIQLMTLAADRGFDFKSRGYVIYSAGTTS
jgi:ADP-ribose pyrophosphatase YjhB (NUDIX family)